MNNDARAEQVEIFEETKWLYTSEKRLVDSVTFSKQNQQVIEEEEVITAPKAEYDMPAKVVVSQRRNASPRGF